MLGPELSVMHREDALTESVEKHPDDRMSRQYGTFIVMIGSDVVAESCLRMSHSHRKDSRKTLFIALLLTGGFAVVEFVGGWLSHSLALIGDAGHMTTDAMALGLGMVAAIISRKGATERYTFGLRRAEVLGALLNVLFMYGLITVIAYEAIQRLNNPAPVGGLVVMGVAAAGLVINLWVFRMLHAGERTLNTRAALLHVAGDLLGSVSALIAGAVIWRTGWYPIDPILSLLICALIALSSTRLLLESVHLVMEGVPSRLSVDAIRHALLNSHPDVRGVHDLHVWQVSSDMTSLTAHVEVAARTSPAPVLEALRTTSEKDFGIRHVTFQLEPIDSPTTAAIAGSEASAFCAVDSFLCAHKPSTFHTHNH